MEGQKSLSSLLLFTARARLCSHGPGVGPPPMQASREAPRVVCNLSGLLFLFLKCGNRSGGYFIGLCGDNTG